MARSTPTYTPVRNYALGFILSAFLLFSDISYGTFAQLRGFVQASNLYIQMISGSIFEKFDNSLSIFQESKNLAQENKLLREQIQKTRTEEFIKRKDLEESLQIIDLQKTLVSSLKSTDINIFKIDSIDLRKRNFIQPNEFPYNSPGTLTYDSGDYEATLNSALKSINYDDFNKRKAESKAKGKLRGLGISCYIEACGVAPSKLTLEAGGRGGYYESSTVRINPTGSVTVFTGSHSHGQGHETVFAQIVHEKLGVAFESIDVVHGDTGRIPFGVGTVGSRSLAVGGPALMRSIDKIIEKGKKIAAHLLDSSFEEIVFKDGEFSVSDSNKFVAFADVVGAAYVPGNYPIETLEPGLEETSFYDPPNLTYPAGAHICEIEIDPDTGEIDIKNYCVSDDFGIVMNPMIVEGQVHGGVAQGIGQALFENCMYEENTAQLINGSFMDYTMPRADNVPHMIVETEVTPCAHGLGVKGCGEAGAIAAPPAVIHAILDALKEKGVTEFDMPATPNKVWNAINNKS